ncbi:MAG: hypothetical protein CME59_00995 [Halioglobus sp.]|nr:hypothetical protein [Halioglobus sp.]|tara:strand:- start:605 stop:1993 length:1389 start_codon:yes stop_codon:yes gene_type:complete
MNSRVILLLFVVPLLLLTLAFFLLFEPVHSEEDMGWSLQAWRNPLLAAQQFLQRTGVAAQTEEGLALDQAFPAGGAVYVSRAGQVLTAGQAGRLIDWMRDGGHLILVANAHEQDNPLLQAFDLEVYHSGCGCAVDDDEHPDEEPHAGEGDQATAPVGEDHGGGEEHAEETEEDEKQTLSELLREYNAELQQHTEPEGEDAPAEAQTDPALLTHLSFEDVDYTLRVALDTDTDLSHPALYDEEEPEQEREGEVAERSWAYEPVYHAGTQYGVHYMQFEVEQGLLTVLAGASPFTNGHIGEHDHAYLLWLLTVHYERALLLYGAESPGLMRLLLQRFPHILISLLLLLGAVLWAAGRRFGPVIEPAALQRRGMHEHLHSSGNYHWQHGQVNTLLQPLIDQVRERASRIDPDFASRERAGQLRLLSRCSQLPEDEIDEALHAAPPHHPGTFTQRVQLLKQLGDSL